MTVYTSHCVPNGQFAAMEFILTAESANFEKAEKSQMLGLGPETTNR